MIVKIIDGDCNSWTYFEADEITVRRMKMKDLGKFEYSYYGQEVDGEHTVYQISLSNGENFQYVVVPGKNKATIFLMGNNGKTIDKIN